MPTLIDPISSIDESSISKDYEGTSLEEKLKLIDTFRTLFKFGQPDEEHARIYLLLKRYIYKNGIAPPTAKQFLDPSYGWLSHSYVDSLWDHVKEDFCNILEPKKNYRQIAEYGCIRQGKSYLARLLILYTIVFVHHLRDPQLYFKVGGDTLLKIFILSFDFAKVKEVYLAPLYHRLEKGERFIQVIKHDLVKSEQYKRGNDVIVYSKAGIGKSHLTLASDLNIISGNDDALSIIGSDMLQCYISELAYFCESAGATEENIFRIYADSVQRIKNTVKNSYLGFAYLDTSANDAESQIENYILSYLKNKPVVYFRQRKQWEIPELVDELFKEWKQTGKTFTVCTGNGQHPAKIINHQTDRIGIPEHLLVEVPIDVKQEFEEKPLTKMIKDVIGIPTSNEAKFIQNVELIARLFDNNSLQNILTGIAVDSMNTEPHIIWNQIRDTFFTQTGSGKYNWMRAIREGRYLGLDLAYGSKGDLVGITVLHKEWSRDHSCVKYVVDFSFPILPGENGINLTAIVDFIIDLVYLGGVYFLGGAIDSFQSEFLIQQLETKGIKIEKHSTRKDITTYNNFFSSLLSDNIKIGKNIFLKNNLDSLHRLKDKTNKSEYIDHAEGKSEIVYNGSWDKSNCGKFHNDVSDSLIQALYLVYQSTSIPLTIYEDMNRKFEININEQFQIPSIETIRDAYKAMLPKHKKNPLYTEIMSKSTSGQLTQQSKPLSDLPVKF
jgi:hypothetical protein